MAWRRRRRAAAAAAAVVGVLAAAAALPRVGGRRLAAPPPPPHPPPHQPRVQGQGRGDSGALGSSAAAPALRDAPYTEVVSSRYLFAGGAGWPGAPTGWGVLPYDGVTQLVATTIGGAAGAVVVGTSSSGGGGGGVALYWNGVTALPTPGLAAWGASAAVVASVATGVVAIVNATTLAGLTCASVAAGCAVAPWAVPLPPRVAGGGPYLNATLAYAAADGGGGTFVWLGSAAGGSVVLRVTPAGAAVVASPALPCAALAASSLLGLVACGTPNVLALFNATTLAQGRTDWVSNVTTGAGGVYDDVITGLAFDDCGGSGGAGCGTLWVANPTALNARYANGTVVRFAGLQGLPITTLTSVAVDGRSGEWWRPAGVPSRVWLGTPLGAILFDPAATAPGDVWVAADGVSPVLQQRWRYFNGPRWLPVSAANATWAAVPAGGVVSVGNVTYAVSSGAGVAALTAATWTLADKAAWYEAMVPRHDRSGLGLVADCALSSFGNVTSCTNTPCESNGLWTGIQLAAEVARYAVTNDTAALAAAMHFALGMQLLINVTGNPGYPARSVIAPWEPPPTPGGWWFNATAPGYAGWYYQSNTSSDSTTGHLFSYGLYAAYMPLAAQGGAGSAPTAVNTSRLLQDVVAHIIAGNFTLIDPNGVPTLWGNWNPATLNDNPDWSDGRGVNSVQMVAFLAAALGLAAPGTPAAATFAAALAYLTAPAQDYAGNLVNAKIEAPTDDNYSDDELTFLPYALYCTYAAAAAAAGAPALPPSFALSLGRTFAYVRAYRPALWSVIYLACTAGGAGAGGAPVAPDAALTDAWWNLATWPLELIDWPIANSQRADVRLNPEPNRNMQYGTESATVLPANERGQYRWNADPYALDTPGTGTDEYEPGAWLLPYWLGRLTGSLST